MFFGTGTFAVNCSGGSCSTSTMGDMTENDTALMNTPSQGTSPWELVSMNFVASATSETLSFLAWGDNGNETNLPPTVFLAGVNSPSLIPEPSTWAMMESWCRSLRQGGGFAKVGPAGFRPPNSPAGFR